MTTTTTIVREASELGLPVGSFPLNIGPIAGVRYHRYQASWDAEGDLTSVTYFSERGNIKLIVFND